MSRRGVEPSGAAAFEQPTEVLQGVVSDGQREREPLVDYTQGNDELFALQETQAWSQSTMQPRGQEAQSWPDVPVASASQEASFESSLDQQTRQLEHDVDESLLLGRYRIDGEAGYGGFSSVMVAWDTRIQRQVAIKCMPLEEVTGSVPLARGSILVGNRRVDTSSIPALEEARTAAMLSDSAIVQVYDFEVQGNMAYLILEYVDGMTLGDLLEYYDDYIDADIVATVFKAVAHALQVAHKNHVLHLDIKPENILINGQGHVKVTDFGLARLAGEAGYGVATGGTIGYMPPEQMRQNDLDERCDEWALASLTYEMISGSNPFIVDSLDSAEDVIYDAELVVPSLCMEGLDTSIDDIMFCALDPDRDGRYDTVKEFAAQMQPCLGSTRRGTSALKRLVGRVDEDPEDDDPSEPIEHVEDESLPALYSLTPRMRSVLMRIWTALSALVASVVVVNNVDYLGGWQAVPSWIVLAGMVVVAALLPSIGAALSWAALGIVLCIQGAFLPGVLLLVVAIAWWWIDGRTSNEAANVGTIPLTLGAIGLSCAMPFVAGFLLKPRSAALTSVFSSVFALMAASFGSMALSGWNIVRFATLHEAGNPQTHLIALVQQPDVWIMIAGWIAAAVVMSVLCGLGKRILSVVGVVLGVAIQVAALVAGSLIVSSGVNLLSNPSELLALIICSVGALVVASLFVPWRVVHRES